MTEDGPSVPKTPRPTKIARPLDLWFDASKAIVERATALLGLHNARGRALVLQTLVYELNRREADTTTTVADLFEAAFRDRSGAAFWRARLSLMTDRGEFTAMLLPHLTAENSNESLNRLQLGDLVSRDLPASGLLREDRFDPLPVVRWIGERECYQDMLPRSLLSYLGADGAHLSVEGIGTRPSPVDPEIQPTASSHPEKRRGRPSGMRRIIAEWAARQQRGEASTVQITEAKALRGWYIKTYPAEVAPAVKTIQHELTKQTKQARSP